MSYLWAAISWVLVPAFQYGYHLSALNQVQKSLSCFNDHAVPGFLGLPSCIPMDDAAFGLVTSIFTIGGLVGSLLAGTSMDRYGRKGASMQSTGLVVVGSLLMAIAPWYFILLLGRFSIGVGAGIGVCVVPVYLSEIAPPKIRGTIVVLNQLAIVIGILVTQAVGIPLAAPTRWRLVLAISALISLTQLASATTVTETPSWLADRGRKDEAESASRRLWQSGYHVPSSEDAPAEASSLLPDTDEPLVVEPEAPIGIFELLRSKELRRPVLIAFWIFLAQQGSGINAIMYYSNDIFRRLLPDGAAYVSLLISLFNFFMTFPPIFLVERVGRRTILLISIIGCIISTFTVALGLNMGQSVISSVSVIVFVGSFAIGLGPIPFVIVSEIVPTYAVGSLSSFALSFNWLTNFIVGVVFLPLRNALSNGSSEGNIFYVFTIVLIISGIATARMYHG